MKIEKIYFLESDFGVPIKNKLLYSPPFRPQITYPKRVLTDIFYFFKLLFLPKKAIVIAPWGLFWIPAIWNRVKIKNFKIVSLTCDTFLSEKTINERNQGLVKKLKYMLAKYTYGEVSYFIYCTDVVKEQLLRFGVEKEKLIFKYQEWIRDDRGFVKLKPNLEKNNFIFIGHYYNVLQKRLDILIDAFLRLRKEHKDARLDVIGRDWEKFFNKKEMENFKQNGVVFHGSTYDISKFLEKSAFYVHPGEFEGFGLVVIESMLSGLIPLVSETTGAKEAVEKVSKELITKLSANSFYQKMKWLISLPLHNRQTLSSKARQIAKQYNQKNSVPTLSKKLEWIIRNK